MKEARDVMVEANTQEYAFNFLQQSLKNKIQDAEVCPSVCLICLSVCLSVYLGLTVHWKWELRWADIVGWCWGLV